MLNSWKNVYHNVMRLTVSNMNPPKGVSVDTARSMNTLVSIPSNGNVIVLFNFMYIAHLRMLITAH